MPVTVKLSRQFYDRLGDEVTNELVNWFNQVDTAYRSDLRELNELNFARFEASLGQRLAELRADLETRFERQLATLRTDVITQIAEVRTDLIKWMFVFWAGSTATTIGIVVTALKLGR